MKQSLWIIGLFLAVGCSAKLPVYDWEGADAVLRTAAGRYEQLGDISGVGSVELKSPHGKSVTLDCAIAALGTTHLRLRAWKFQQAVLDVTLNPQGLFVWRAERASEVEGANPVETGAAGFTQAWSWVTGDALKAAPQRVEEKGEGWIEAVYGDPPMAVTLHGETRTLRRVEVRDGQAVRASVELKDLRMVDGVPWPMEIGIVDERGGRVVVKLRELAAHQELPVSVFDPPGRAVKQP